MSWPDTASFQGFLLIVLSIAILKTHQKKNYLKYWPLKDTVIPWSNRALQSKLFLRLRASLKHILEKLNPDLLCLRSPCGREPKGLVPESRFVNCVKLADDRTEGNGWLSPDTRQLLKRKNKYGSRDGKPVVGLWDDTVKVWAYPPVVYVNFVIWFHFSKDFFLGIKENSELLCSCLGERQRWSRCCHGFHGTRETERDHYSVCSHLYHVERHQYQHYRHPRWAGPLSPGFLGKNTRSSFFCSDAVHLQSTKLNSCQI